MLTVEEVAERAAATTMVEIIEADREEFAIALVLQGYAPARAHQMAFETIGLDDGALQMLARHRLARVDAIRGKAMNLLGAFGGDVPDWLRTEYDALLKACEA